jgi:hypothetical protein
MSICLLLRYSQCLAVSVPKYVQHINAYSFIHLPQLTPAVHSAAVVLASECNGTARSLRYAGFTSVVYGVEWARSEHPACADTVSAAPLLCTGVLYAVMR